MRNLHDAIQAVLEGLPEQALSGLIEKKLAAQGVKLSKGQCDQLTQQIMNRKDHFRLQPWRLWDHRHVTIEFTPEDAEQVGKKLEEFIENRLPDLVQTTVEDAAHKVLATLKRRWPAESRRQRQELAGFRKRLYDRWKVPLETLRMLLTMSRELGEDVNHEIRHLPNASSRRHLIDVLARSHARACQIVEEILCLLEGGFSDGAIARWRTLHEIAVVDSFIAERGEDLAERYVLHQAVEAKRASDDYQKCQPRLGYEPLANEEIESVQKSYDAVIARYGADFAKGDYGWAGHHLGKVKATFKDIEAAVHADHFRAHYRMASHNVHANPKGVFFRLGMLAESQVLLAGPSNAGLADPGHGAALSLARITSSLAGLQQPPAFDNIVALLMIVQLVDEIGEAFGSAHARLEADDAAIRPR
jgi:hypothetical protein